MIQRAAFLAALCLLAAACASPPSAAPTLTAPPRVSQTATPPAPAEARGPWLMLPAPGGLWAYDTRSGSLDQVETLHLLAPQDVAAIPAPSGGRIAYITGINGIEQLTLHIRSLAAGEHHRIPILADEHLPPQGAGAGDPRAEAVRALFEAVSIAWSPDGTRLAFTAVLETPRAELYLLDVRDLWDPDAPLPIRRLTDGPGHTLQPAWAPGGEDLVYVAAERFDGESWGEVRTVPASGGASRLLAPAAGPGVETFLGWHGPDRLLLHARAPSCGSDALRTVDLAGRNETPAWSGPFNAAAYASRSGALLVAVDRFAASCPGAAAEGLYRLSGPGAEPVRITTGEAFLPVWDGASGLFFARTGSAVLAVGPGGSAVELQGPEPVLPSAAPDGTLAWALGGGVWTGALNGAPAQIFAGPAAAPAWSPDGQTLYFLGEAGLYRAASPGFEPELVGIGDFSGIAFWLDQ